MPDQTPSELIDARLAALGDWRGEALARMRRLIREADPAVEETVKWRKPSRTPCSAGLRAAPCRTASARARR